MATPRSRCTRPPSAACRSNALPPYHPSGNSYGCRAVGHVLGDDRTGSRARAFAKFDGRDQHRIDAHEGAVADLGPVLVRPVEVGGNRTGADVGVLAQVGVAQVGHVRHLAAASDLRPDELREAADVDVLADHGAWAELRERTAV